YAPGGRGVRVDSHAYSGYTVPPNYDSMIAKLIATGSTRASAIDRMRRALGEYLIAGIKTTIPFHNAIMRNADFRNGNYDTGFVDRVMNSESFELKPSHGRLRERSWGGGNRSPKRGSMPFSILATSRSTEQKTSRKPFSKVARTSFSFEEKAKAFSPSPHLQKDFIP